ncbi:hypothetical protein SAMN04489717_4257 [Actinopolymorpha singaporensis]|uniref:Uncharacterized protein n=1 Tax=Actinopolymorpha singaporensis TaxID=117157 RepID=A0A1H1VXX1_9ACTN|nr:hypothetical protein [Actinopolymorpha singaporensis]SDS89585.1 hypothetical protein SAMN04489717_4257 [Actinopolymorpha singaporensis]
MVAGSEEETGDAGRAEQRAVVGCAGTVPREDLENLGAFETRKQRARRVEQARDSADGRRRLPGVLLLGRADHHLTVGARHDVHGFAVYDGAHRPGRRLVGRQPYAQNLTTYGPDEAVLWHLWGQAVAGRHQDGIGGHQPPVLGAHAVHRRSRTVIVTVSPSGDGRWDRPAAFDPVAEQGEQRGGDPARVDAVVTGQVCPAGDPGGEFGFALAQATPSEFLVLDAMRSKHVENPAYHLNVVVVAADQQRTGAAVVDVHTGRGLKPGGVLRPQAGALHPEAEEVLLAVPGLTGRGEHPCGRVGRAGDRSGIEDTNVVPGAKEFDAAGQPDDARAEYGDPHVGSSLPSPA